jgi:hypothetical protein
MVSCSIATFCGIVRLRFVCDRKAVHGAIREKAGIAEEL